MQEATRIIRSTLSAATPGQPLHAGPVFAAPFHAPGDPSETEYTYARSHNPTWTELEEAIGQMESAAGYEAHARIFGSGMAACAAVLGAVLRPGDIAVLPSDAYFAVRSLFAAHFEPMGCILRTAPTRAMDAPEVLAGARLLWIETPSNPGMDVADIAALAALAHTNGTLVAVDNTTATPLGQRPLALGADFSVASDSKAMTGHSDLLLGHVATRDPELLAKIDSWRTLTGGVLGPMEAWLALRSIGTLPLRLAKSCANAQAIAEFLAARPEVREVFYPGLRTHPGHAIAARQMQYFGPVLSFTLKNKAAAETFLTAAELVTEATSFGGLSTTAERRARWGHDLIPAGFIRMSAGCEEIEDLLADMAQALEKAGA
ncbi:cystathionine gamma-lyase [Granulicella rosea]|uniref:Cystathionine gamma-lyase n=1 Tax=Granulicella rosea TaxID=474952 RepID=A0A239KVZ6_9BACT|nr:cystathionine gamma-lyase [Granulicella rosea]SNT22401.1 cystathionine gamma-lyase [Granulicella rosea]